MQEQYFILSTVGNIVPGLTPTQVQQNLRAHLKLSEMNISAMFSGKRTVIKKHVNFKTAQQYIKQFYTMGLMIDKEPVELALESPTKQQHNTKPHAALTQENSEQDTKFPQELAFEFKGDGKEYFKIWIVNITLTVLTLGVYSAWAKVRNKLYFYGNTFLDGSSFEYTATPIQILKGRIVAVILLSLFFIGDAVVAVTPIQQIIFSITFALIFIVVFPLLVIKTLEFNARYSRYRNIAFNFKGDYGSAFKYFILLPLAGVTIVLIPYVWQRKNKFFVKNSFYGTEPFEFSAEPRDYLPLLGVIILTVIALAIAAWVLITSTDNISNIVIVTLFYVFSAIIIRAYFKVHTHNVMYNNTIIKQHSLSGNYEFASYLKLLLTNTLGILLTVGLFIPWAKMRTAHYHAEHTQFIAMSEINDFIADEGHRVNSLAEGLTDANHVFDAGVGI